jgi:hypothetical protein
MKTPIVMAQSALADVVSPDLTSTSVLSMTSLRYRRIRYTDITPASRFYLYSVFPPTSPKIHELLERWEF